MYGIYSRNGMAHPHFHHLPLGIFRMLHRQSYTPGRAGGLKGSEPLKAVETRGHLRWLFLSQFILI